MKVDKERMRSGKNCSEVNKGRWEVQKDDWEILFRLGNGENYFWYVDGGFD